MFYHTDQSFLVPFVEWMGIFIRGVWMDISLVGYIMLLSGVFMAVLFFSGKATSILFRVFTALILAAFIVIVVGDLELYRHWGFRIDSTPLFYLQTPAEATASLSAWAIALYIIVAALLFCGWFWLYRRFVEANKFVKIRWWSVPIFLFFAAVMIIPIRGGFGIAPMNPGKVYFSSNVFSNHAALNAVWNFIYGITKSSHMYKDYPQYVDEKQAESFYNSLGIGEEKADFVLTTRKPNVVVILLESFTSKLIEPLGGKSGVTPRFSELSDSGLLFKNIYASGDRSDKGMVAVLSGFPAQSTESIIKHTLKASKLPSIISSFADNNYSTTYYYGGDPDFANMRSFLLNSGIERMITQDDFPRAYRNSKWGVHDEHVFQRLLSDIDTAQGPFFKLFFTLTSHEPFEIPREPAFTISSDQDRFINSVHYTDEWLGWFFDEARNKDWYDSTLFVLIADHGHRFPGSNKVYDSEKFKIPMLWLGGALEKSGIVDSFGSQTDLASTLLSQLGMETDEFVFSRNLLAPISPQFAYYAFNDGFGFVTPSGKFIWDHVGGQPIVDNDSIKTQAFSYFRFYHNYFLGL